MPLSIQSLHTFVPVETNLLTQFCAHVQKAVLAVTYSCMVGGQHEASEMFMKQGSHFEYKNRISFIRLYRLIEESVSMGFFPL